MDISDHYEYRSCPKCDSPNSEIKIVSRDNMLGVGELFYISQCDKCGLKFQNPALKQDFLSEHYPDDYAPYDDEEMSIDDYALVFMKKRMGYSHLDIKTNAINFKELLFGKISSGKQLVPKFVSNGKLLEVACASGTRLELLRKLGWNELIGIEFSKHAALKAREKGFEVYDGRIEDTIHNIPDNSLDVIIASFVMEHIENPFFMTNLLSKKLKPEGQFIFSTLNINSPDFKLWKENWYDLDLPRHFTFYRKSDLYQMLKEHFKIDNIYYQPAPNDYMGSARYWLKNSKKRGLLRYINKFIVALGNRLYYVLFLFSLFGLSTRIVVYASKKK